MTVNNTILWNHMVQVIENAGESGEPILDRIETENQRIIQAIKNKISYVFLRDIENENEIPNDPWLEEIGIEIRFYTMKGNQDENGK